MKTKPERVGVVLVSTSGRVTPGVWNPFLRRLFRTRFQAAKPAKRMASF